MQLCNSSLPSCGNQWNEGFRFVVPLLLPTFKASENFITLLDAVKLNLNAGILSCYCNSFCHCLALLCTCFTSLNFVRLENYRGCFIQPRLRQWMSYSPWCVICRQFVFFFFFLSLCGRFCENSMILVDSLQKTPQSACLPFVVARQVSSKHPGKKQKRTTSQLRSAFGKNSPTGIP